MASIQTGIELNDGFSYVLEGIIRAVSMSVDQMEQMQQTMNQPMHIEAIEEMRSQVSQAAAAYDELAASMRAAAEVDVSPDIIQVPSIPPVNPELINSDPYPEIIQQRTEPQPVNVQQPRAPPGLLPDTIEVPVQAVVEKQPEIEVPDGIQIPADVSVTGTYESAQKIAEIEARLNDVAQMQEAIQNVASSLYVLPDGTSDEIRMVNREIVQMDRALTFLKENPFSMDSSIAEVQIQSVSDGLDGLITRQRNLDTSLGKLPSQQMEVEVFSPDPLIEMTHPVTVPVETELVRQPVTEIPDSWTWASDRTEVQIQNINRMMQELGDTQMQITRQANETDVLSPQAQYDVELLENKLYDLQQMIADAESNSLDVDAGQLEAQLRQAVAAQESLNQAMQGTDVSRINQAYLQLSDNIRNTEELFRQTTPEPEPVEVPIIWRTENLDVFTGTGMERFRQEIQNTNSMLEQLSNTQDAIARQAYNIDLFPPEAFQNLNQLAVRIDMVRDRIQQIENNRMNIGTDRANTELERLRSQLSQALQEQNQLNAAMECMDVSAANDAYLQLSQTVSTTERYIRDNVDGQGRFNQEIQEGTSQADALMETIKGAVAAYVSVQGIGKALSISDDLIQTTSRLNMMNDEAQTTGELMNMVYAAAQDARGSLSQMADVVARFGNNAKDAFSSSEEVIAFANLIQKQMMIAGASTQEAANAELQLSQALGSGVLRGDELNSIFEQAPNLIQSIAKYISENDSLVQQMALKLNISEEELASNTMGHIRDIASEGMISADIVKAAVFASADDINNKFESMPMTWGQIWQSMQNTALIAFQPVLQRLNDMANSEAFQIFVNNTIEAMATLTNIVLNVFELLESVGSFISDHWSAIGPIVYGVAAALAVYYGWQLLCAAGLAAMSTAQIVLNAAMSANPIMLIVMGFIAFIAILMAVCNAIAQVTGVTQSGLGLITGLVWTAAAFIGNIVIGLVNQIITWGINLWNMMANFAAAFGILFNDPVAAIEATILSMFNYIVGVVGKAAALLDAVFGSNLADAVSQFQGEIQAKIDSTIEGAGGTAAQTLDQADYIIDRLDYSEAFQAGALFGDGIAEKLDNFSLSDVFGKVDLPDISTYTDSFADAIADAGVPDSLADTAGNTARMADSLSASEEDLKYLRDIAEQEAVNRFTTAEITISQTNHNTINHEMDLDGVIEYMTDGMLEAIEISTEGVHV